MKMIFSATRTSFTLLMLLTVLLGFAYSGASTLLVQSLFPEKAAGNLIKSNDGTVLGSKSIGQNFSEPRYFWGRLSAANYDGTASTGSNLGSANPKLLDAVKARIDALKAADPRNVKPIPVDLVTASGSGLDPEISIAAAEYQVSRVAAARGIAEQDIRKLLQHYTASRQLGVLGEPRVNVLQLNLALDGKGI